MKRLVKTGVFMMLVLMILASQKNVAEAKTKVIYKKMTIDLNRDSSFFRCTPTKLQKYSKVKVCVKNRKVLKAKADKYLNKAWELHEHEDIELMKSFLQRKMEEEGCDALELAAAMLKLQVGDKGEEIAADEYTKRGNRFGDRGRSGRGDGEGRSFGRGDGRRRFGRGDRDRREDGSTGSGEGRRRRRSDSREDGRKWNDRDRKNADRKPSAERAEREAKKRKKREEPGIGNSFPKRKRS